MPVQTISPPPSPMTPPFSSVQADSSVFLEWVAPAYGASQKTLLWYVVMGMIVFLFVLYGMLSQDPYSWVISVTFLLMAGVYYLSELKSVPAVSVRITGLGVRWGSTFFPFREIKSFWILEDGHVRHLNLLRRKGLQRELVLIVPDEVRLSLLREYLLLQIPEEEERKESFTDQLIRHLGL